jgi:hypothetical protein
MLGGSLLRSTGLRFVSSRLPTLASTRRGLCNVGVEVDMVCRVWSCKVKDDASAALVDEAFDEWLDDAAQDEGCAGATRLLCKSEWDYKLLLKFEDSESLKKFLGNEHSTLSQAIREKTKDLVVGDLHEQNFVYDDIE